jgi:hypothetical protein
MRMNTNSRSFPLSRQASSTLSLCMLALCLVMPAGCIIAQDTAARQLEIARKQLADVEAKVAQLQAELERERAIAAQWKAKGEAAAAQSAQLRAQLLLAQSEHDKALSSLVETADALQAVRAENAVLKADNKRLQDLAVKAGLLPKSDPDAPPEQTAPPAASLQGVVVEVKDDGSVVISLGTADGLRSGDQLHIYRDMGDYGIYVGQIEITDVAANTATCKFVSRQDTPRKDDRVVTRL